MPAPTPRRTDDEVGADVVGALTVDLLLDLSPPPTSEVDAVARESESESGDEGDGFNSGGESSDASFESVSFKDWSERDGSPP